MRFRRCIIGIHIWTLYNEPPRSPQRRMGTSMQTGRGKEGVGLDPITRNAGLLEFDCFERAKDVYFCGKMKANSHDSVIVFNSDLSSGNMILFPQRRMGTGSICLCKRGERRRG